MNSKKIQEQNRRVNQNLVTESLDRLSYVDEFSASGCYLRRLNHPPAEAGGYISAASSMLIS